MTPCERKGWKPGDIFVVICGDDAFAEGSIVMLEKDDLDDCPLFCLVEGYTAYKCSEAHPQKLGAFVCLHKLRKLEDY